MQKNTELFRSLIENADKQTTISVLEYAKYLYSKQNENSGADNMKNIHIEMYNDQMTVSSREIARNFEKEHRNVIRDIETIIAGVLKIEDTPKDEKLINSHCSNLSSETESKSQSSKLKSEILKTETLFIKSFYINERGRKYTEYKLTRDGFSLLVMGFTGQKALKWKLDYIEAFNEMERRLSNKTDPATVHEQPPTYKNYNGANVLTVRDISEITKVSVSTIRYTLNSEHFTANKDYFLLAGKELRDFSYNNRYKATYELYIITESGCSKLFNMFGAMVFPTIPAIEAVQPTNYIQEINDNITASKALINLLSVCKTKQEATPILKTLTKLSKQSAVYAESVTV